MNECYIRLIEKIYELLDNVGKYGIRSNKHKKQIDSAVLWKRNFIFFASRATTQIRLL